MKVNNASGTKEVDSMGNILDSSLVIPGVHTRLNSEVPSAD